MTNENASLIRQILVHPAWGAFQELLDEEIARLKDTFITCETIEDLVDLKARIVAANSIKMLAQEKLHEYDEAEKTRREEKSQ